MLSSSSTDITNALQALQNSNPNIQAVALASIEGRILESTVLTLTQKVQIGSTCAALIAIATKMSNYMQLGNANQMLVKGEAGSVLLIRSGVKAILAVIIGGTAPSDSISVDAQRVATRLAFLI